MYHAERSKIYITSTFIDREFHEINDRFCTAANHDNSAITGKLRYIGLYRAFCEGAGKLAIYFQYAYLVHVQLTAVQVKLLVEVLQHVDDHHRRCRGANGREPDYVAEQHRNVRICLRLDRFSCTIDTAVFIGPCIFFSFLQDSASKLHR